MDSNEYVKCGSLIRDVPVNRLATNRENITLLWFDATAKESNIFDVSFNRIRTLNDYVLFYTQKSLYLDYLMSKEKRHDHVIAVLKNTEILDETHRCEEVHAILLIISDDEKNLIKKEDYQKVVGIFEDENSMLVRLQQVIVDIEHNISQNIGGLFSTFNRKERTLQDVRDEFALFMWRQAFKVLLKAMPHTLEAREELLNQCRSYYDGNPYELARINEFERNYNSNDTVSWYTKSCFLFRLLNKALRTEDITGLYIFRYFINDLSTTLETTHAKQNVTRVYRGGEISKDEIENYSVGMLVAANSFLSTSCDLDVAERFAGLDPDTKKSPSQSRDDPMQHVLVTIDIDWHRSPDIILADISAQSDFFDEHEVLFDIGTTFEISEIKYDDEQHLWRIQMQPSMEVAQHNREYKHYIGQRLAETNATLLFGILLTDMGDYEQSASYFERLLARMANDHEDRANAYYSAARIYRYTNQHDKALEFFYRAETLQRTKLPESNFDLARTLAGIASVYYEIQDYQQELSYYQQSMDMYERILPENHIEIARTYNRLGFAYANQKEYAKALDYLSKSLDVFNRTVPDSHPDKALALHNVGLVHHAMGHLDESRDFYQKSLKMREVSLPPQHPYIAQSCYRLGILDEEQGQYRSALEYSERALTIYEKNPANNAILIVEVQTVIERLHEKLTTS